MAKEPGGPQENEIELKPDGWSKFERAVDAAVKGGPKHKAGKRKAKASTKATKKPGW